MKFFAKYFANSLNILLQAWIEALSGHLDKMENDGLLDSVPTLEVVAVSNLGENALSHVPNLEATNSADANEERRPSCSATEPALTGAHTRRRSPDAGGQPAQSALRQDAAAPQGSLGGGGRSFKRTFTYTDPSAPPTPKSAPETFIHRLMHHKSLVEEISDRKVHTAQHDLDRLAAGAGCPIGFAPEARDNFARTYTPGMPGFTIQTVPNGHNSGRLFVFR